MEAAQYTQKGESVLFKGNLWVPMASHSNAQLILTS